MPLAFPSRVVPRPQAAAAPFEFFDPGPLIDGELELIPPQVELIDDVLAAAHHPESVRLAPADASVTRERLVDICNLAPNGRQPADPSRGWVPAYQFWMRLAKPDGSRPFTMAGGMGVRIGATKEIELYMGNVGYHVYPPSRGHHYAERAVRLVLPLMRRHGMPHIWITTNPDNVASRRTCERLGAVLIETVKIPRGHPFRTRGETAKCRYLLYL